MKIDRVCLSYWFPKLEASGVAVPKTRLVRTELPLIGFYEGEAVPGVGAFLDELRAAAAAAGGFPCFLRTGHGSGKHGWRETCFVPSADVMGRHVAALVEWSHMVDLFGLPTKVWAVRELLPLRSAFTAFDGFPVNVERRYFIGDGRVLCRHPYWPAFAVADGKPTDPTWEKKLDAMNAEPPEEVELLTRLSVQVADRFRDDGAWSLDWAQTEDGAWIAIDMAPAERSYHWPDCTAETPRPAH